MKGKDTGAFYLPNAETENRAFGDKDADGPYAMVKDQRLIVCHPKDGPYPVVVPCQEAKLIVNGRECTETTPVTIKDTVRIEVEKEERKEGKWSLSVSPDGLYAELRIRPTVVIRRELSYLPPARVLHLKVVEREERIPPFTLDELLEELSRLGINYGIDWEACSRAAASCDEERVIVARGVPAQPGRDAWVELHFSNDSKIPVPIGKDEIVVDLRERFIFTSVEPGDVLAVKHPPEQGIPGTSVKGDIIVPPTPQDCSLIVGEGAFITQDGKQAVATRSGRPIAKIGRNKIKICVLPELVHHGDVDLASGNLIFKGDVLVSGNVLEGMTVEAGGHIRVAGFVSHAKVRANGSILIKGNILASVVVAGGNNAVAQKLQPHIKTLATGLQEMSAAVRQLLQHPAFKRDDLKGGIGPLIRLLLESKFCSLPYAVDNLKNMVENLQFSLSTEDMNNFTKFIKKAELALIRYPLTVRSLEEIEALAQQAAEWEQAFSSLPAEESDLVVSSILNSNVVATGDIRVIGSGCFNSSIHAGKEVTISGVFRGGEIQAGGNVYVREMGSKCGAATKIVTVSTAKVTVGYAFDNATVVVGKKVYKFNREEANVCLWLDKKGNLKARKISA
ncbi:MAG: DUF342 domain-containing protein [Clostridia bacterium]|nr:DUF342 domain-containing protein [Clostridia bacterium]